MIERPSASDLQTIAACMRVVLESDEFFPGEVHIRLGVDESTVRTVLRALPDLASGEAAYRRPLEHYGISLEDIDLAISGSLNEVAHGLYIDEDVLQTRYGTSRQAAQETLHRWRQLVDGTR